MAIHRTSKSSGVSALSQARTLVEFRLLRSAIVSYSDRYTKVHAELSGSLVLPPHLRLATDAPCNAAMQL